jgi:hypothetical protein
VMRKTGQDDARKASHAAGVRPRVGRCQLWGYVHVSP